MKKLFAVLIFSVLLMGNVNKVSAQENYGNTLNALLKFGDDYRFGVFYEIQIIDNLTVSPEIILQSDFDSVLLGARADYYFDGLFKLKEPWDIYGGLDAGFNFGCDTTFEINFHAGAEYKFAKNWGALAEIGVGTTTSGGIGIAYHF